jgi:uncharacterized sulfatase
LLGAAIAVSALLAPGCGARREIPAKTADMNVLFLCLEDCTTRALGCYGNPQVKTPNLDRLAASGVRFERAYSQGTSCNPSRASFLTGLRPPTTRVFTNEDAIERMLPPTARTLPELLGDAGFYLACVGKLFHHSPPQLAAFDRVELWPAHRVELWPAHRPEPLAPRAERADERAPAGAPDRARRAALAEQAQKRRRAQSDRFGAQPEKGRDAKDVRIADRAVELLEELADRTDRFFLSVGFVRPHTPVLCPQRFLDLYDPQQIELPPDWDRRRPGFNPDLFTDHWPTEPEAREATRAYYGCVSFVDEQVGKVLDALERTGLANDTIVVLFADHGFQLGEHGYWSKYTLYEPTLHVPAIVRVPGNPANGSTCSGIVELVDLLPTVCDLAGVPIPGDCEGTSFAPLLRDPQRTWKKAAFAWNTLGDSREVAVRGPRFLYTYLERKELPPRERLHDLDADPWQLRDVHAAPEYEEPLREARALRDGGWRAALPAGG